MAVKRNLKIVGPWYRWQRQWTETGTDPRESVPVIQKYDRADMIGGFLGDPQHCLTFTDDDYVYGVGSGLPADASELERLAEAILTRTDTRKLFLPTHHRFYLVVCQLSCDAPGLPDACRKRVAKAGFVLRRTRNASLTVDTRPSVSPGTWVASTEAETDALALARQLTGTVRALRKVSASRMPRVLVRRARRTRGVANGIVTKFESSRRQRVQALASEVTVLKDRLAALPAGVLEAILPFTVLEGWVPSEHDGIGSWQAVDEEPTDVVERTYPLYPLIPDPRAEDHSAEGATLYFGVVPASSMDTDAWGTPQLDPDHAYKVRCFVREEQDNGCLGAPVWSRPTESFQLASHMDPVGTANRSITIHMPDLKALAAHAAAAQGPPGGVRMVTPDESMLQFQVGGNGMPVKIGIGGGQVCFFYIPLITIVARFVLSIFLPIVVIVFDLWWMLLLKLCIPPSGDFTQALTNMVGMAGKADADIDVDVKTTFLTAVSGLAPGSTSGLFGESNLEATDGSQVAAMAVRMKEQIDAAKAQDAASRAGTLPEADGAPASLVTGLVYETRVYGRPTVNEILQEEVA